MESDKRFMKLTAEFLQPAITSRWSTNKSLLQPKKKNKAPRESKVKRSSSFSRVSLMLVCCQLAIKHSWNSGILHIKNAEAVLFKRCTSFCKKTSPLFLDNFTTICREFHSPVTIFTSKAISWIRFKSNCS